MYTRDTKSVECKYLSTLWTVSLLFGIAKSVLPTALTGRSETDFSKSCKFFMKKKPIKVTTYMFYFTSEESLEVTSDFP